MRHGAFSLLCVSLLLAFNVTAEPVRRSAYLESEKSLTSVEVKTYAQETGLDVEESRLALAREELAAPQISALRAEFADRIAGLFWVRLPAQHIVVRLTGSGHVPPRNIQTEAGIVPVEFVTGAAATADRLGAALSAAGPDLRKLVPELSGAWVDETTGKIVLDVASPAVSKRAYDAERAAIEKLMGFPVEFRFPPAPQDLSTPPDAPKPASQPAASTRVLPNVGGGRQLLGGEGQFCTAGFAVKHAITGVKGVLTAGHCFNTATYTNYPVAPAILPTVIVPTEMVMEAWGGIVDFQWHMFPPGQPVTSAYCVSFTDCSNVVIYGSTPSVGASVCHMGRTTGKSCGTVTTLGYEYSGTCTNTDPSTCPTGKWIRVEGPNLACAGGDSGGPVFNGYSGYGLAKAAASSGPLAGACDFLIVMPIGRIAPYSLVLL
ncbi:S1 family peptidase [Stenotrophomonas sp. PD6]|uniref:S1 family peptidase n=1 Tax=Stenotrophomonas sp. PD6 TaxID=3368612 RepID=UPI003BA19557